MVAILEKSEHNIDFHPMVDFIEASPFSFGSKQRKREPKFSLKSTGFNEFSSNIATALA
nr:hypothetical protein [Tanacetum cinerariifolium]